MRIGELSKKTSISIDTICYYEKEGLIKPVSRNAAGYREYDSEAQSMLEFISHCRALDLSLLDIRTLLRVRAGSARSCREANEVIEKQLVQLRQKIVNLKRLEKNLASLQKVCHGELDPAECPIIWGLQKSSNE